MSFNPLYKKDQLILGDPENQIGIVTLWTARKKIAEKLGRSQYAAIGQLYSATRGLDFMVRNLLANPQIRHLMVTGLDLSHSGVVLQDLFQNGVVAGKTPLGIDCWKVISQHEGYIDRDISQEAIDLLRRNVKLYFVDDKTQLVKQIEAILKSSDSREPYSEPLIFKKREQQTTLYPGEDAVYVVRGETVAETWIRLLDLIMKFGRVSHTHFDSLQKEILDLVSVISKEDPNHLVIPDFFPFTEQQLQDYFPRVLTGKEYPDCRYTYGQRLRSHFGIDQVEAIINKLCRELDSRSATASLWDPVVDNTRGGSPCLNNIWVRIVENRLYLTAVIRSNDMYAAWPENAFSLRKLQELFRAEISQRVQQDFELGDLIIVSQSAHIYDDCWEEARRIVQNYYEDWVPYRQSDPRGSFFIEVSRGSIQVEHLSPQGEHLGCFEGKTAREIQKMLTRENLLSSPDHALYLGRELQKAEMALNYPDLFEYVQDRALNRK